MHAEQFARSVTEDTRGVAPQRADYLFDTKTAAVAVGCHPNKFGDWWRRTEGKLIDLYIACPGELAAELAAMIARAEAKRQSRATSNQAAPVNQDRQRPRR